MDRDQLILEIKKQLQEELKQFKSSMTEQVTDKIPDEYKKQAKEAKDTTAEFIKDNPLISVIIAAFVGFILARLFYKERD